MYGVWLDREKARIFVKEDGYFHERIAFSQNSQQAGFLHFGNDNPLFHQAANELKDAKYVLLVGPGLAKLHFRNYLMEQYPSIARKVIGCEQLDASLEKSVEAYLDRFSKDKFR